ncbi:MAG TPA: Rid family hydrolase [Armatimonadota bacterium]
MPLGLSQMRCHAIDCGTLPVTVHVAQFQGQGGVTEYHLMVRPTEYADVATQMTWIDNAYQGTLASLGLESDSAVLRRFFCSDLANQAAILQTDAFTVTGSPEEDCAISWVCQPPLPPAKVALWAYHLRVPEGTLAKRREGASLACDRGELSHRWTVGATCPGAGDSEEQTHGILQAYAADLQAQGLHLADHVLRTWFFVQNIDANYHGLVKARREFFASHGLIQETHYIASTGIQGGAAEVNALVMMDAYAIAGVRPEQICYLSAPDHLCPTHRYGVTFERGVSIAFRDRTHILISGTASIDMTGSILHTGDVLKQLDRTLENVRALLQQAGATFDDVCSAIVYVRDPSDLAIAQRALDERCGDIPLQLVVAPVCRPGWLIEVECQAIISADNPELPAF